MTFITEIRGALDNFFHGGKGPSIIKTPKILSSEVVSEVRAAGKKSKITPLHKDMIWDDSAERELLEKIVEGRAI